jgi:LuxR family maltose regulon positive regulatory protein
MPRASPSNPQSVPLRDGTPAKLRPPRLQRVVVRERLFARLDLQRAGGAVWIAGAPGAGKTMLAASYLRAREQPALWCRLDVGDNDLGRLFETLARSPPLARARQRAPVFAPEHLAQPTVYARRWFRWAFGRLPAGSVWVFDNIEQSALPALPELLAAAIDELPEHTMLIVTARHGPPPPLAAALLSGALAVLAADELRFTSDEALHYARELGLNGSEVLRAAGQVDGWAAGLRLLSHAGPGAEGAADASSRPLLSDYFASLLHDRLAPALQRALWIGALLPWIDADLLAALSALETARAELDRLCADNLFVEPMARRPGDYRLHPAWREFLLQRGQHSLGRDERAALRRAAAQAFEARGEADAAIDLWLDAGDHAAALERLLAVRDAKLALGQVAQWSAWVARLPASLRDTQPALHYGLARIAFLREDASAPLHYERACDAYAACGDLRGQQLCAAGALEWGYNTDNFIGHRRWCELLRRPIDDDNADEATALRLLNGRVLAAFFGGDFAREAQPLTEAVLSRLAVPGAVNEQLSLAVSLLGCLERHKRWPDAQRLAVCMEALLDAPGVGPRLGILVRQQIAIDLCRQTGEYAELQRLAQVARELAHAQGFAVLEYEALAGLLFAALYTGETAGAERTLATLLALGDPASVYHQRFAQQMQTWLALQLGQTARAAEHAQALRVALARSDMPRAFLATWLLTAVLARFAQGDEHAALDELDQLAGDVEPAARQLLRATSCALQAWRALRDGNEAAALPALHEAFTTAAAVRYFQLLGPLREALAALAACALIHGIEPTFARQLVKRRCLRASGDAALSTHWPWPLRVHTLGHFALFVDGQVLVFDGKLPKKPLALLKALVALGPQPVPEAVLADALWPDDEADAAHAALNMALHRLRKLVPAEAIRLHDGSLALDPDVAWVDARAFEAALSSPSAGAQALALALYLGHFLPADEDAPWTVSARERLRARFARALATQGQALAAAGRHDEALALYRRGLDTDDLDESFHQGVMRAALALQRPAEGMAAYQRARRLLAARLGVAPAAETERLRRALQAHP